VTGISEILVLILLICGILILPRMFKPAPKPAKKTSLPVSFNMKLRAGIVASVLVPVIAALIIQPWKENLLAYICTGVLPVVLTWALVWILAARKK